MLAIHFNIGNVVLKDGWDVDLAQSTCQQQCQCVCFNLDKHVYCCLVVVGQIDVMQVQLEDLGGRKGSNLWEGTLRKDAVESHESAIGTRHDEQSIQIKRRMWELT